MEQAVSLAIVAVIAASFIWMLRHRPIQRRGTAMVAKAVIGNMVLSGIVAMSLSGHLVPLFSLAQAGLIGASLYAVVRAGQAAKRSQHGADKTAVAEARRWMAFGYKTSLFSAGLTILTLIILLIV